MMSRRTVTLAYACFAALLLCGALSWLSILIEHLAYGRFELGDLDRSGLDSARALRHLVADATLELGLACGGLAYLLTFLPRPNSTDAVVQAHKRYQQRGAAILLLFLGLVWLSYGRMGALDVDLAAVPTFAWGAWTVATGWRTHAGGRALGGPAGWGLALAVDLLALAAFAILWIGLEIEGVRMI